jgi:hypothetical protein
MVHSSQKLFFHSPQLTTIILQLTYEPNKPENLIFASFKHGTVHLHPMEFLQQGAPH